MRDLTDKQARFAKEYLIDFDATQAAIRAGYSAKTASQIGYQLLQKTSVIEAIKAGQQKQNARLDLSADAIANELGRIGFFDPRKLYSADGILKKVTELDDDTAAALASIEVEEEFTGHGDQRTLSGFTKKLKFWNKVEALTKLGQRLAMFTEKHDHNVNGQLNHDGDLVRRIIESPTATRLAHRLLEELAEDDAGSSGVAREQPAVETGPPPPTPE